MADSPPISTSKESQPDQTGQLSENGDTVCHACAGAAGRERGGQRKGMGEQNQIAGEAAPPMPKVHRVDSAEPRRQSWLSQRERKARQQEAAADPAEYDA